LVTQLPNDIVDINFPGVLKRATISAAGVFFMWSSVVEDLVDRLIPEGGKGCWAKLKFAANAKEGATPEKIRMSGRLATSATRDAAGFLLLTNIGQAKFINRLADRGNGLVTLLDSSTVKDTA
jgi:hypothetical protein